jgi:hypothetical protein
MTTHGFGLEKPAPHVDAQHRPPARFMVIIDSSGVTVAKLFVETRELVAEFDAGSEEVALMSRGLSATTGADGGEWDKALAGHGAIERRAAKVYRLDA